MPYGRLVEEETECSVRSQDDNTTSEQGASTCLEAECRESGDSAVSGQSESKGTVSGTWNPEEKLPIPEDNPMSLNQPPPYSEVFLGQQMPVPDPTSAGYDQPGNDVTYQEAPPQYGCWDVRSEVTPPMQTPDNFNSQQQNAVDGQPSGEKSAKSRWRNRCAGAASIVGLVIIIITIRFFIYSIQK